MIADNLSVYWPLEESNGGRVDVVQGIILGSTNNVGQATGKVGMCAQFNAASSRFLTTLADDSAYSLGDVDCTWMCWVYFDDKFKSTNGQRFFSKDDNSANREYLVGYETGADKFTVIVWSSGSGGGFKQLYATTFGSPSNSTWYCIFAWHDSVANTLNISVNNGATDSKIGRAHV